MYFQDKRVLVTGGTRSMGKILIRRILSGELGAPEKVIVFCESRQTRSPDQLG
jgi:FlaA1/EpsC-like NDP-sugar epimerase